MGPLNPIQTEIGICVILWLVVLVIVLMKYWSKKAESSGFTFIYVANLALIHLIAAFSYILPSSWIGNEALMLEGFREATYAVVAFGLGNVILSPFFVRLFHHKLNNDINMDGAKLISKLPKLYFIVGAFFYFILVPTVALPTLTAIIGMGGSLWL